MPRPSAGRSDGIVVAIEGPSGSGKSSVAAALARRLDATLLHEAFDRLTGRRSLAFRDRAGLAAIERRLLAEEARRWSEAIALRRTGRRVVLDTGTAGPLSYSWGLREGIDVRWDVVSDLLRRTRQLSAEGRWGLPDLTFYLDVPEAVADARAARSPLEHPVRLRERHRVVGRFERLLYEREFPRRLPGRFGSVVGEGSPGEIALGLVDRLERLAPVAPVGASETERFLDLFEGSGPPAGRPRAVERPRAEVAPSASGALDPNS